MKQNMLFDIIRSRRSPVVFSDAPVGREEVRLLVEAARLAPSSYNAQPWAFIYASRHDQASFNRLFDCLLPGNREWVQHRVPLLVVTLAERTFPRNGKPNLYSWHDLGLATMSLIVQAGSMGLAVHPMGGFDREKTIASLDIPENLEPVCFLAVGFPGDPAGLPADIVARDRKQSTRKPLETMLFSGRWGGRMKDEG